MVLKLVWLLFALGHRVTNGICGGRPAVEGTNFLFKPQ